MGGFYGSVSLRTEDRAGLISALNTLAKATKSQFLVAPPIDGWICVYPDVGGQDEAASRRLARCLDCDLIHLISHDEDIFSYLVYRDGRLLDRYDSVPGYFCDVSAAVRRRRRGRPRLFADLFDGRATVEEVEALLANPKPRPFSSDLMVRFAVMLGLPHNIHTSYEYLLEDREDVETQYQHIPDMSEENANKRREAEEVEARKRRHRESGELLVERFNERPGEAIGNPIVCPDPSGSGFLACPDAGYGEGLSAIVRYGPPWSAGPSEAGIGLDAGIYGLFPSPSGRYLAIEHGAVTDGRGWRIDLRDGEAIRSHLLVAAPDHLSWFAFTPDESRWIGSAKDRVLVGPLDGSRPPDAWPLPGAGHGVVHPGGEVAVISTQGNRLSFVELATGRILKSLLMGGPSPQTGLPAMVQLMPKLREAMTVAMSGFDLAAIEDSRRRKQDELRRRILREGFRPVLIAECIPDEQVLELRARIVAAWEESQRPFLEEIHRLRREHLRTLPFVPLADSPSPSPAVAPPTRFEELYQGAESPSHLLSDPEGRRLFCGTDRGLRVFDWTELAAAIGVTPAPTHRVGAEIRPDHPESWTPSIEDRVGGLAYDAPLRRLLFATIGGQIGFLDLDDGRSGILLDVPGRPPLMSLHLALDRATLRITCHPDRFGPLRHRSSLQIWDYPSLTSRSMSLA